MPLHITWQNGMWYDTNQGMNIHFHVSDKKYPKHPWYCDVVSHCVQFATVYCRAILFIVSCECPRSDTQPNQLLIWAKLCTSPLMLTGIYSKCSMAKPMWKWMVVGCIYVITCLLQTCIGTLCLQAIDTSIAFNKNAFSWRKLYTT